MEITIKKGLNLRIEGEIESSSSNISDVEASQIAISPDDFEGFIPKTAVRAGDKVKIGDPLLFNKNDERIKIVSPLSGTVKAIERGARRHIDRIVVEADSEDTPGSRIFDIPEKADAAKAMDLIAEAGLLAFIRRRPFADIPSADVRPRDIFVSAFDSSPLAVNPGWTDADKDALQAGASLLSQITVGKVYVSCAPDTRLPDLKDIVKVTVAGPHPAGLPGVQAANIAPVNKGETIWTLSAATMWRIGRLLLSRTFDPTTTVAVCGSCVSNPYLAKTVIGAWVRPLLDGHLKDIGRHERLIAGNILTGVKIDPSDGFLHYPYTQLTVIPEGDDVDEFMGWASLSPKKMSVSPTYPGRFFRRLFNPDARVYGGRRAMIMSGEYDRVLPMDIMPEYLIKAINGRDIDAMEKLGIYEVAPEDFALAECLDSSKQPLQAIVREGLDYLRKELM